MRNIFIIGFIIIGMGYMFSLLFDRYNAAVEEQKNQRVIETKQ